MNDIQFNRLLKNTVEHLESYLKEKELTQVELADQLGISQGSLSAALHGKSRKGIVRVAEYLIEKGAAKRVDLYETIPEINSDFELSIWNKLNDIEDVSKLNFELLKEFVRQMEGEIADLKGFKKQEE